METLRAPVAGRETGASDDDDEIVVDLGLNSQT